MQIGYYWFRWKFKEYPKKSSADIVQVTREDRVLVPGRQGDWSIDDIRRAGDFLYSDPIRFKGSR